MPNLSAAGICVASQTGPLALTKLLDEWIQGTELQETFEVPRRSLDEERPDGYKLFS